MAATCSSNILLQKLKVARTNVSNRPLPKRKIFPFMSLPAELRNQIYALALTDAKIIHLVSQTKRYRRTVRRSVPSRIDPRTQRRSHHYQISPSQLRDTSAEITLPTLVPNVLVLNKAIYAETQPILYAGNTFAVEDTMAMHVFLAIIGPKNRATVTDLTIRGWGQTKAHKSLNHPAFTMLASAMNLTRLQLDCHIWGGPKRVARQLYWDGFHWFEAVGVTKGKFDAALDMLEVSERYMGPSWHRRSELSLEAHFEELKAELRKLLSWKDGKR